MVVEGNEYCQNKLFYFSNAWDDFNFLSITQLFSVLTALTSIVSTLKMCIFVSPWNRSKNLTMPTPLFGLTVFFGIPQIASVLLLNEYREGMIYIPVHEICEYVGYCWAFYVAACSTLLASVLFIVTLRTKRHQIKYQYTDPVSVSTFCLYFTSLREKK